MDTNTLLRGESQLAPSSLVTQDENHENQHHDFSDLSAVQEEPEVLHERLVETHPGDGDDYGVLQELEKGVGKSHGLESDDLTMPSTPAPMFSPSKESPEFPALAGEEGEGAVPAAFKRTRTADTMPSYQEEHNDDGALHRMHKFALYETMTRFFLIGSDVLDKRYRVLKIERTAPPGQLSITEDETVYTRGEVNELLNTIEDGNRAVGGMRSRGTFWGLLGFIRFTEAFYMLLIKKKRQIATIGGHYIFQIDDTDIVPLSTGSTSNFKSNRNADESRFLSILGNLDLNRHFYFSYSYNVTRTLQHNIIKRREMLADNSSIANLDLNDMFVWNNHLLKPAMKALKNPFDWCMPIIHGFVDQAAIDVYGRSIYLTIIARRSRFFAGARFLKRGVNDRGYVANDVETEQITADMLVTSFNAPRLRHLRNPNYTSFVQHRGSIPLYWTQDSSGVSPKPAIDLQLIDPFYSSAALHFDHLFARYRAPVYVLNLVKARERTPRESKLLVEYQNAINYLNQSLPEDKKIRYRAYDMSRAAKTRGQDVIGTLESIAEDLVHTTGFFRNDGNPEADSANYVQNGVARSNCIDCLDRTNAAQFVIGKRALALQLHALGVVPSDSSLNYDSDACNLFAHMFNDQGDTLASQYGGSHLVNTTDSYRKINNWQSHSRDMLESFKRYYHNSFLDSQRQEAYNLFLGNYVFSQGQPMLWDLPTDYYLHHTDPREKVYRPDYIHWYTPQYLEPTRLPPVPKFPPERAQLLRKDWWDEYYRPTVLTSYHKLLAWTLNSTSRYLPKPSQRPLRYDLSPFSVRKTGPDLEHAGSREKLRAESPLTPTPLSATSPPHATEQRISSLQRWLNLDPEHDAANQSAAAAGVINNSSKVTNSANHSRKKSLRTSTFDDGEEARIIAGMKEFKPSNKDLRDQWTLSQFHANSLNPSVSEAEVKEYERYLQVHDNTGLTVFPNPEITAHEMRAGQGIAGTASGVNRVADLEKYVTKGTQREPATVYKSPTDISKQLELEEEFTNWLQPAQELSLSLSREDGANRRYQAYDKWLKGKSLFKQSKVDPEAKLEAAAARNRSDHLGMERSTTIS